jgi:recombination protein RecT
MNAVTKATAQPRQLSRWEDFERELAEREKSIADMLPQHVSKQRFMSSSVAAVKQNPELLNCTPRSLFNAVTKSAQDGLLPDGREGIITAYNEKQKDNSWAKVAQWNPMIGGLRKRAREIDAIIVNAQVVHENDLFEREEGDDPKIVHKPAPLGTDRGKLTGAYAIFRNGDGILHREVMDAAQIEVVRAQSKAPNSLMWTKFVEEGWKKTVVRRGFKSVPCSEKLDVVVRRDDDMFNFEAGPVATVKQPPRVVQSAPSGERKALPPVVGEQVETPHDPETGEIIEAQAEKAPQVEAEAASTAPTEPAEFDAEDWLLQIEGALSGIEEGDMEGLKAIQDKHVTPNLPKASAKQKKRAQQLLTEHTFRVSGLTPLNAG